jgi:hypothetical protein
MGVSWQEWRLSVDGLTWRVAGKEDAEAIADVLLLESRKHGPADIPNLFDKPVLLTLVAEDENGVIVDGVYIEAVAEVIKFATDRRAFAAHDALLPVIGGFLQERGLRIAQMTTLKRWANAMAPALERLGFKRQDGKYSLWVRRVAD